MRTTTLLGIALAAAGCGGQNTKLDDGKTSSVLCVETLSPVQSVDDVTSIGFRAADVLEFATGDFTTSLMWASPTNVAFGPESGRRSLALRVSYRGGPIAYVQSRPNGGAGGPARCADHLRITVSVGFRTESGALDETFEADLNAATPFYASLAQPLDPRALNGSFQVTQTGGEVRQFGLIAIFSPLGTTGQIASIVETVYPGVSQGTVVAVSATPVSYATWPASASCATQNGNAPGLPAGVDVPVAGFTGHEGLSRFNAASPLALSWRDGSQTRLALSTTAVGEGCARFDGPVGVEQVPLFAAYPVTIAVATDDGRISGEYPGKLTLSPDRKGGLDVVSSLVELSLPVDQASASGFTVLGDVSQYGRLSLSFVSQIRAGATSGEIVLNGLNVAACATQPVQQDPTGGGTMACEGTRSSVIERGSWRTNPGS